MSVPLKLFRYRFGIILLVLMAMLAASLSVFTCPAQAATCPAVFAVGVAGSGEPGASAGSMGLTSSNVLAHMSADLPAAVASQVKAAGLPYAGVSIISGIVGGFIGGVSYPVSRDEGVSQLTATLSSHANACPNQLFVLAGLSQGADVIATTLSSLDLSTSLGQHIETHVAGVALFGDPGFNPFDSADLGNYNPTLSGIFNTWPTPPDIIPQGARAPLTAYAGRLNSYCNRGDPICNYSAKNAVDCFGQKTWALISAAIGAGVIGVTLTALIDSGDYFKRSCPHLRYTDSKVKSPTVNTAKAGATLATEVLAALAKVNPPQGNPPPGGTGGSGSSDWVELGGNAAHTGMSTSAPALSSATAAKLHELWSTTLTTNPLSVFPSSPVVAGGIAYVLVPAPAGGTSGNLEALSAATGAELWTQSINGISECPSAGGESMTCEPVVAGNVVLAVGSYLNTAQNANQWTVNAFDAQTGKSLWTLQLQYYFPTLAVDGNTVYIAADDQVEAVSSTTGTTVWTTALSGIPSGAPAIANGHLYVITYSVANVRTLTILDSATGAAQASITLPSNLSDAPPVVDQGRVFITIEPTFNYATGVMTAPAYLTALDGNTGATLWYSKLDWATFGDVGRPVSTGGLVIVGDTLGNLAGINPATGAQAWLEKPANPPYLEAMLCAESGDVLVTSGDSTSVGLINVTNGALLGTLPNPTNILSASAPAIDVGNIYLTSGGNLVAFGS